jgi:putative ABC transport system permease protein
VVESVGLSSELPGGENFYRWEVNPEGFARGSMSMNSLGMDEDYLHTYNIQLVAGRSFSEDVISDAKEAVVLNEAAVKYLGWTPDNAIGKEFEIIYYTNQREDRHCKVIGITKDFHYQTLHHAVEPLVMHINKHPYYSDFLTVKVNNADVATTVDMLQAKWKAFHPDKPLEFLFVDDQLQKQYASETRISTIFSSFALLSIIISCLGLFGLSAFSAQKRMKEIGIRKVLGAGLLQIVKLLSLEYVVMVTLANVIAWPLAFYFSREWLSSFPYRTTMGVGIFAFTLFVALGIALVTISVQSIKAALINPVKTLKSE